MTDRTPPYADWVPDVWRQDEVLIYLSYGVVAIGFAVALDPVLSIAAIVLLGICAVCFASPATAIFLAASALYISLGPVLSQSYGFGFMTELMALGLGALFVIRLVARREFGGAVVAVALLFMLYFLSLAVTLFWAEDIDLAFESLSDTLKAMLIAILLVALTINSIRFRAFCDGLIAAGAIMALVAVGQFLTGSYWSDWGGFAQAISHQIAGQTEAPRASGPLSDSNHFSQILLICLPVCLARMTAVRSMVAKLILCGIAALVVWTIFLTFSRGGLLAMLAILLLFLRPHARAVLPVLPLLILVAVALPAILPGEYVARTLVAFSDAGALLRGEGYIIDPAVAGRLAEMKAAWLLFLEHPLAGVGYGQFEAHYQDTARHYALMSRDSDRQAHSLYLETLAERGLIGGALLLLLVTALVVRAFRTRRVLEADGRLGDAALVRGMVYGLMGYLAASVFLHDNYRMYFWLALAGVAAAPNLTWRAPSGIFGGAPRSTVEVTRDGV